ncbi:MAG: hypothetical protein A3G57_00960 [Candidatus Andersenbacteria bacterium RIFCSPLOWO2_12_FULL_45_8]|nr:MAG: hypothetical protein A3I08_04985 [Candidatus Andersenbacteria bacterium RIFCSPLOWO2_02_FULL_46_11]OGY38326.1 MAG: hypothetical protein A3G57_00960 [Candidatus Andersenbacteria bacterium RIFCSPLOWO2_12_FULL_45_8]HBE89826.1 hypothetical protein [Candidatus Andersenbacteria bacterium]
MAESRVAANLSTPLCSAIGGATLPCSRSFEWQRMVILFAPGRPKPWRRLIQPPPPPAGWFSAQWDKDRQNLVIKEAN